ncbi:hypothetical protein Micbo1qcDRAFT_208484 [Microdochium bolleyi]|uniref:Uncharacterized protein n=1 Tax=Microdochium bolleyi TaxID=196109 RepID=A0A136IQ87_9PEZI|nr:hypothetical protein Micbo1qcDRAFT_208484 [Microdochium bolleyi]
MYKSLVFAPLLFLGAASQQIWVASRISRVNNTPSSTTSLSVAPSSISSTSSDAAQDVCLSSFTTTITPSISYFTVTTTRVEALTTTRTDNVVEVTTTSQTDTFSTTTSETELTTVSSTTIKTELDTTTETETRTETTTSTETSTVFTTETVRAPAKRSGNERGPALVNRQGSTATGLSTRLCDGVRPTTVTATARSSTVTVTSTVLTTGTVGLDVTTRSTTTTTQTDTDTITQLVTVTVTSLFTSTTDETSTTTFLETTTASTTETTTTTSTSTSVIPTETGIIRAQGSGFDGQYAILSGGVFYFLPRANAGSVVITPQGHIQLSGFDFYVHTIPGNPFIFYSSSASIAANGYPYVDASVGSDGRLSITRNGVRAYPLWCTSTPTTPQLADQVNPNCAEFSMYLERR